MTESIARWDLGTTGPASSHHAQPALATRPWLALGEVGSCGFRESRASGCKRGSQFSLRPRCLQPARGWGPGVSVPGPGWSQRTANGTEQATVSYGGCSLLASQPLPPTQPLPSWVGVSQALHWAQLHLPPLSWGHSYRVAGGQVRGRWRGVSVSPRWPQWFPWRSCKSQCRHWQSRPGGVCYR